MSAAKALRTARSVLARITSGSGVSADALAGQAKAQVDAQGSPVKLKRWRQALARSASGSTAPSLVVTIGDSTERTPYNTGSTNGGALTAANYRLSKLFSAAGYKATANGVFGMNGFTAANMALYYPGLIFGAGWVASGQQSLGGSMFLNTTDTSALSIPCADPFNRVIIHFRKNPAGGVFTVDIGGAVLQTVTTGNDDTPGSAQIDTGAAPAAGNINIKRVSGSVEIAGAYAYDAANPGLIFINGARGGWNSSNWVPLGQGWTPAILLRNMAPSLIIDGNGGVNDVNNNADPTTPFVSLSSFIANKQTTLTYWSQASDILLETMPPQDFTWSTEGNQLQYVNAVKALAAQYNFAIFDQYARLVSRSDANTYGMYGDARHPSNLGHADKAAALFRQLTS